MSPLFPLVTIAGSPPVRSLVNRTFHWNARRRVQQLESAHATLVQERMLMRLVGKAKGTRFGRDHRFGSIRSVADFQDAVPLRSYEDLWRQYLRDQYPIFDNLTWPGRIPYLALTSGTTQGATKYIPVSRAMLASNLIGARTMVSYHLTHLPESRLFHGRLFFLGGSSDLEQPAPGVRQGDLSGIASKEVSELLRPYTFPPLELALEPDWDRKLALLAERSFREPITLVGGVPSWLLALFQRLLDLSGKATIAEVWPRLEVVVHGGVKFDPYREAFAKVLGSPKIRLQETYPCSEGFIAFGDPATGHLRLLFDHGIFYEFVPVDELESDRPTRHWLGNVQVGINYAIVVSTCAGMWSHLIGDTVRFESVDPPLLTFTGRTKYTLSAFGEHLISEEVEAAVASASASSGASVREWHVGPVFQGALGHHLFVFEFLQPPDDLTAFRRALDTDLAKRNADYQAHRVEGVGLPLPALLMTRPGGFDAWMRSRGKLGGQHKVPRMDSEGKLTEQLAEFLLAQGWIERELPPG
ncbi:GH3 family domain-containing protein [Singulisphaera acidiphila]|uniref:Acyl-CoA synthetase (AMP-forming)/AMP-acid ligase II n=1 Tax=Singulisphaera acidiphila (strain ATCC BAA-1392 / DSM 18658 / VKM B-2454 / MOB10) TaxID=886293 RepID=L0DAW6_SINAD|nr:GH3 auxin-responsive promoter family protein [Singulisphaera acidiphila]AGA25978.1 acyl-CoA synthetase (AMP-forming)/AMP-acid ligase II [Singulisphaera acidiphila DSM 18658]